MHVLLNKLHVRAYVLQNLILHIPITVFLLLVVFDKVAIVRA